jgi:hypothetical protein
MFAVVYSLTANGVLAKPRPYKGFRATKTCKVWKWLLVFFLTKILETDMVIHTVPIFHLEFAS